MNKWLFTLLLALCALGAQAADAVHISNAWARATAPGQDVGAVYMTLKSSTNLSVTKAETAVADTVEIHEMSMANGVMKMRMMETLSLPAGQAVKLAPGGFHFMLFDLKQPLKPGSQIELVLTLKDKQGKTSTQAVKMPVKAP